LDSRLQSLSVKEVLFPASTVTLSQVKASKHPGN